MAALPNLQIAVSTEPILGINIDNTTVKGITFTGKLFVIPNVGGASVIISAPGDLLFLECIWRDFTGEGLLSVGANILAPQLAPNSIEVDVRSSTFSNVVHGPYLFRCDDSQTMSVSESYFSNVDFDASLCGCTTPVDYYMFGCGDESICEFKSNCMSDTNFDAALFGQLDMSQFEARITGNNFLNVVPKNENDVKCTGTGVYKEAEDTCMDLEVEDEDFCGFIPTDPPASTDPPDESCGNKIAIYVFSAVYVFVMASIW
jgi:hypothetical protein